MSKISFLRAITQKHPGMTVVELIVAMSVATLIILGMLTLITHIFTTRSATTQQMMSIKQAQDVVDFVARDLRFTERFLPATELPDPNEAEAPTADGWNFAGTEHANQLILEANATTHDYRNPDNQLLFEATLDCASTANYVMTNIVYFVKDGDLFRRTIVPNGAATCPGSVFQTQTCQHPDTSTSGHCQSTDLHIASHVSNFAITYHDLPYNPENALDPTGSPDSLNTVPAIRLNITINDENSRAIRPSSASILLSKGAI